MIGSEESTFYWGIFSSDSKYYKSKYKVSLWNAYIGIITYKQEHWSQLELNEIQKWYQEFLCVVYPLCQGLAVYQIIL